MTDARPHLVIVNAALGGARGNTASALEIARRWLRRRARVEVLTLAPRVDYPALRPTLVRADGFLFGTGTHWDSWSSLLQAFLEDATPDEGTSLWLGKPAACVVTEHSVGGKEVLSRLQGVLVTLGCEIPPMSGVVLSRAAHVAAAHAPDDARDWWSTDDLRVVGHNLIESAQGTRRWRTWPVDRQDLNARWLSPPS